MENCKEISQKEILLDMAARHEELLSRLEELEKLICTVIDGYLQKDVNETIKVGV
ncbi:MAG: hypothetical protein Q4C96_06205 [Planctomycetia bacterium]|nr:hypothetical protein [Planctomycetia bacterium]